MPSIRNKAIVLTCPICKKEFNPWYRPSQIIPKFCSIKCSSISKIGILLNPCSEERKRKISEANKGEKSHNWKGERCSYRTFHAWLTNNFGLPKQCEHCGILSENFITAEGLSSKINPIHYALVHGKKHSRRRENYLCLCYRCHRKYDMTEDFRKKQAIISKNRNRNLKGQFI